jgi:hypothetical protein
MILLIGKAILVIAVVVWTKHNLKVAENAKKK